MHYQSLSEELQSDGGFPATAMGFRSWKPSLQAGVGGFRKLFWTLAAVGVVTHLPLQSEECAWCLEM